mmetsp:Transcript_40876/g.126228  ORF Transcript_40876/g.126228 Transcript_40876/m.126228 type:complete len:225 (-) Transcript_40876:91-765(-)
MRQFGGPSNRMRSVASSGSIGVRDEPPASEAAAASAPGDSAAASAPSSLALPSFSFSGVGCFDAGAEPLLPLFAGDAAGVALPLERAPLFWDLVSAASGVGDAGSGFADTRDRLLRWPMLLMLAAPPSDAASCGAGWGLRDRRSLPAYWEPSRDAAAATRSMRPLVYNSSCRVSSRNVRISDRRVAASSSRSAILLVTRRSSSSPRATRARLSLAQRTASSTSP